MPLRVETRKPLIKNLVAHLIIQALAAMQKAGFGRVLLVCKVTFA